LHDALCNAYAGEEVPEKWSFFLLLENQSYMRMKNDPLRY